MLGEPKKGCPRLNEEETVDMLSVIQHKLVGGITMSVLEWNQSACFFRRHFMGEHSSVAVRYGGYVVNGTILKELFEDFYRLIMEYINEDEKNNPAVKRAGRGSRNDTCACHDAGLFLWEPSALPVEAKQNNNKRYALYAMVYRYLYAGGKQRVELPACCVNEVRRLYPEPNGIYVGFKPSQAASV